MNKKRLLKIAEHLEHGKLGHSDFDFSVINMGEKNSIGCGTHGCAVGEFPIIFPEDWIFDDIGILSADCMNNAFSLRGGAQYLGITFKEFKGLFVPYSPAPWLEDRLTFNSSKEEVALSIRRFIKWKEEGNNLYD